MWYELTTKVTWPTGRRLVKATTIVVVFIMIWAIILGVFDYSFSSFQKWVATDYYDPVALQNGEIKKFGSAAELQKWMDEQKANKVKGYVPEGEEAPGTTIPVTPGPGGETTLPIAPPPTAPGR